MRRARAQAYQEVFSSRETPGLIVDGLLMRGDTLARKAAAVRALLRAWFRAVDDWNRAPAEGDALLRERLKGKTDDVSRRGIALQSLADNRRKFAPGNTDASLHHVAQQYIEHFVTRATLLQRPDPATLLDPRFLP